MTLDTAPIHFGLPYRQWLANGTMLVHLPTLDDLKAFWKSHRDQFAFAVQGPDADPDAEIQPQFLHAGEWIFGRTKVDVMRTLLRWGHSGIDVTFYACTEEEALGREGVSGWWRFTGLPEDYEFLNLMCEFPDPDTRLHYPDLLPHVAAQQLLEQWFDDFGKIEHWELATHDREGVDALVEVEVS